MNVRLALLAALLGLAGCRACGTCPPPCPPPAPVPPPPATPEAGTPPSTPLGAEDGSPPAAEDEHAGLSPRDRAYLWRLLPKESRWAKAMRALLLSREQVARLQAAVAERDASLEGKAFLVTRLLEGLPMLTAAGDTDELASHAYVGAIEEADAAFDARVAEILSPAQARLWHERGFARAFGRRLPMLPPQVERELREPKLLVPDGAR